MIQVNNVAKFFGDQNLFNKVTFTLNAGEKVGLVGRNGSGKSTLLKMILGQILPDEGTVTIPKSYTIGYLEQHIHFTNSTVLEEVASFQLDTTTTHHAEKILFGLGFGKEDLERDPRGFSGGQQLRIQLAKVLVQEANLLLLDEPTNYLDILSIRWLQRFLQRFPGEVILITHDRAFMDEVSTSIMGIYRRQFRKVTGKSEKFYQLLAEAEAIQEKTRLNQERKKRQISEFVTKFRAKARQASLAQSRMKMLEKMEVLTKVASERQLDFSFNYGECPAKVLLEVENLTFAYPHGPPLISNLSFAVERDDRIGVIGKNGKGKSTLLNLLSGHLVPTSGELHRHQLLRIGHFGQTNIERLHSGNTVEQEIMVSNPQLPTQRVRSICGTMMFEGDLAKKKISVLSGGEKARVMLGKILANPSNLLLLDEPTNHLDQESVEALAEELALYEGAVLLVTHSEYLLKNLANKLLVFQGDQVTLFHGDYQDFLAKVGWEEAKEGQELVAAPFPLADENENKGSGKLSYKDAKRKKAEIISEKSKQLGPLKAQFQQLEQQWEKSEKRCQQLQGLLLAAVEKQKGAEIAQLTRELKVQEALSGQYFEQLSQTEEKLVALEKKFQDLLASL